MENGLPNSGVSRVLIAILVLFIFPINSSLESPNIGIRCNSTKVWGPGLENLAIPARYFFVQSHDENGHRFNETLRGDVFSIRIFNPTDQSCRIRSEVLNRSDGSLIVRYRVYSTCSQLAISVRCLGTELPDFPRHINSPVFPEECPCAFNNDIEDWMEKYGCQSHFKRIETDFKIFKSIDVDKNYKAVESWFSKDVHRHSICNYVIKKNQIYRKCYGQYTGFKMFTDSILLFITRRVRMPDVEILMNLGDWPLITDEIDLDGEKVLIPMFSWCGSNNSLDIVMPTYDITESSLESMGRVSLDMLSVQGNTGPAWKDKIQQLFWRGRDSSRERLRLIEISRQNKHLINASLTDFFFFRDEQEKYGPKEKRVSFFDFFKFKYQLNMDGTVAAYRFPYLLAGDSVIFKQDSPYYEFFYDELVKWKHYIPVKRDLSDLVEKLEWAVNHDEEVRKIALNGQEYARNNLLPHHIFCYYVSLFYEYSKKLVNKEINIRPDMEMVSQTDRKDCQCRNFQTSKPGIHNEL